MNPVLFACLSSWLFVVTAQSQPNTTQPARSNEQKKETRLHARLDPLCNGKTASDKASLSISTKP